MDQLIGRKKEIAELKRCSESKRSEFVIVYGRRRIGKTFLVRQFFGDEFAFSYVGVRDMTVRQQLDNFALALQRYSNAFFAPSLSSWMDAFRLLRSLLEQRDGRKIVFIDEMPWMDKAKSDFVTALENFWNGWASTRNNICLIACGSATSWMADKLIYNQGGLHNRITCSIYLRPFTLAETEQYMESLDCQWDRFQIAQCYMVMGGVPYYWSLLRPHNSLMQNMDRLFFEKNAILREEFGELYYSLFRNPVQYIDVVKALASKREGLSRQELGQRLSLSGSGLTRLLKNLERCDFIIGYSKFGSKKNGVIYKLTDFYTLFYLRFIADDRSQDEQWWEHNMNTPSAHSWQGFSFELLCMLHLRQIKQSLGISGIATFASTWRSPDALHPYQIDLLIDRGDRMINLCEMKFSTDRFVVDKDYAQRLRDRRAWFVSTTKTRKMPLITMVTTYGVMPGKHSSVVQNEVVLDDLFVQ